MELMQTKICHTAACSMNTFTQFSDTICTNWLLSFLLNISGVRRGINNANCSGVTGRRRFYSTPIWFVSDIYCDRTPSKKSQQLPIYCAPFWWDVVLFTFTSKYFPNLCNSKSVYPSPNLRHTAWNSQRVWLILPLNNRVPTSHSKNLPHSHRFVAIHLHDTTIL